MKYKVLFSMAAREDLKSAADWYETEQPDLGEEFINDVRSVLEIITHRPKLFPKEQPGISKARLERFPFLIYFKISGEKIVVGAVFHTSRNPKTWKNRNF